MMVRDIKETVDFYVKNLGFELVMAVPETLNGMDTELADNKKYVWAQIKNGGVEIMLQSEESLKEDVPALKDATLGASCSFYMEVENLGEFHENIKDKVEIVKELFTTWYGMNEFYIRDNNGYILCFAGERK